MMLKKAMLLGAIMALGSTPAWALPAGQHGAEGQGPHSHAGNPTPNGQASPEKGHSQPKGAERHGAGNSNGDDKGKGKGEGSGPGSAKAHRCLPHTVAYVASGVLLSDTLAEGAHRTYSGELIIEVQHGNRHAQGDLGTKQTYDVQDAHLTLAVPDLDKDGVVGVDDLAPGDRVRAIGRITALPRKCAASEFTPQISIGRIVIHGPRAVAG